MIRNYTFDYGNYEAGVSFKVDTEIFTAELAKIALEFRSHDFDENEDDLIDEIMKVIALKAIKIASFEDLSIRGLLHEWKELEGMPKIDGSLGIQIYTLSLYEFEDHNLDMTLVID